MTTPTCIDPTLSAYILAGGRSSRFGRDKARAMLDNLPLIQRQAAQLRDCGCRVRVVARHAGAYADLGLETIGDLEPDRGPVGGVRTALTHRRAGWALITSCDLLEVSPVWIETLRTAVTKECDAIAFRDDRWQPFPGLYHTRLLECPDAWDRGSLQHLFDHAKTISLPAPRDPGIRQVNRPGDLPG